MEQVRSARVGRTTLLTVVATFLGIAIASDWVPLPGMDAGAPFVIAPVIVLLLMGGLPLYNLRLAVLDARMVESTGSWSVMNALRWLFTLANVVINFVLIAVAIFFAAMFFTGPAVA